MKRIAILGSTGSIGTQTLDLIDKNRDKFSVTVLSGAKQINLLSKQIESFKPEIVVTEKEKDAIFLSKKYPKTDFSWGEKGLVEGSKSNCDIVLNALMGIKGLLPTYEGIKNGRDIAIANKETLVAGGEIITDAVKKTGVKLLPVDSEHSAIFQCLEGNKDKKIKKILLTASGGPFRKYNLDQLEKVTLEEALNHPKWNMGKKITIDSATMMNKGLEVIEAKWLFNVCVDDVQIVIHPQSIVHSMVEFEDNSILAQLGIPDMRTPISVALGYPDRILSNCEGLNFFNEESNLTFEKPNPNVFKCINMAYSASKAGGSYPVVLSGANEVLVELFLEKKIKFIDIQNYLEKILDRHNPKYNLELEEILEIDRDIREVTYKTVLK